MLTVYGKYGEEIALLLGNVFFMNGFTLLANSVSEIAPSRMRDILNVLKANMFDVGNAHALELGLKGKAAGKPGDINFVEKKAGSIEADMCLGAIIGGGTETEVEVG